MISIDPKKYKLQGYLQFCRAQAHCFASTVDENGIQIYHLSVILMFLVQTHLFSFFPARRVRDN
jgi:hypothetical protein